MSAPRAYASPYLAGVALGLVLLGAFVLAGQGLGASGAFANVAAGLTEAAAPRVAESNSYFQSYLASGAPWSAWMVVEVLGLITGGLASALLAGRFRVEMVRGENVGPRGRVATALAGGAIMGLGAVLARGCTSGQALTGGALLSVGAWAFMGAAFAAGFAFAPLVRRLWR